MASQDDVLADRNSKKTDRQTERERERERESMEETRVQPPF